LLPDKAATMFNFIKKAGTGVTSDKDEKEKRKRDKKDRKEKQKRERASMSAEELLRLDEVFFFFFVVSGARRGALSDRPSSFIKLFHT
jgi:hypothetical protein